MKKLGIILPYNENHIDNFTAHFMANVAESSEFNFKLIFMKQKSNRPLNKGKLFNIGYMLNKDKFDYFCFHDSDLIPISDECNYEMDERPISLVGMRDKIEFGDQENIENFDDYTLPYDEYFGGATIFSKENFEIINGYSNNYWGVGYEDYDLLLRCVVKGLPIRKELEVEPSKTFGTFNGINSYLKIESHTAKIKNATNKGFTMSAWFKSDGEPPYGADVDSNRCEYFIFGRPGYHMGLSYTHGGFLKGVVWLRSKNGNDRDALVVKVPVRCNEWHHACLTLDDVKKELVLYLDGNKVASEPYENDPLPYHSKPYYIGVGDPDISMWRNFFEGNIAEVGLWSNTLNEAEINQVYNRGIVDGKGEYVTSKLPVGVWDFRGGYDDRTFDISGSGNHAKILNVNFANKSSKSTTERYLPYRRKGAYGYLSAQNEFLNLEQLSRSEHPEITTNRNTFNKNVQNQMGNIDKDGLSSTRFRIVNKKDYLGKHEIIEVVI